MARDPQRQKLESTAQAPRVRKAEAPPDLLKNMSENPYSQINSAENACFCLA
jgi:hypothetical protein